MQYTAYNPETGQLLWNYSNTEDTVLTEINGKPVLPAKYETGKFYWQDGNIVAIPTKPASLFTAYNFDYATKTWLIDLVKTEQAVRKTRDVQLADVDKVNPIWYGTLISEQQQQLQQYRTDLLNVPQQSGFPESVVWPTKPAWL